MATQPFQALASLSVLLVEDNAGDARLIEKNLEKTDPRLLGGEVQITRAQSLEDAFERVDQQDFTAILLDLGLPECSGLETLRRFLEHTSQSPIVILTGLRELDIAFRAVGEGAQDFLHKDDIGGERLARSLRYAIERHRRQVQSSVIESAELALLLVELTDHESTVAFANRACQELTGYSTQQWREEGISLLFGEDTDRESMRSLDWRDSSVQRTQLEQRSYRQDETWFWNEIQVIPISRNDGKITHLLYSFTDVTEKMEWRARMVDLDRMSALGTVADGVAHEINNPLSFITANVEFVLRTLHQDLSWGETEETREQQAVITEALDDAMEGSRRIRAVVDDLQQLAGRPKDVKFATKRVSVETAMRRSLTIVRNNIRDRARLIYNFQNVSDVIANESKLGQVFLNLLLNAAQAITPGDPESNEVRVTIDERPGEVVISISDTGSGICDDDLKRLFEPFFSTKEASDGTGLGMPISKHIINQMGGYFEIDTMVGEGTTVSVVLPAAKREQEDLGEATTQENSGV